MYLKMNFMKILQISYRIYWYLIIWSHFKYHAYCRWNQFLTYNIKKLDRGQIEVEAICLRYSNLKENLIVPSDFFIPVIWKYMPFRRIWCIAKCRNANTYLQAYRTKISATSIKMPIFGLIFTIEPLGTLFTPIRAIYLKDLKLNLQYQCVLNVI